MNSKFLRDSGPAALSLLEALLIHLVESGRMTPDELDVVYDSVIEAHHVAAEENDDPAHDDVADLLEQVRRGRDSVRLCAGSTRAGAGPSARPDATRRAVSRS